ncbi:MAG: amidohydrolase family protein [Planctomycetota bacterium]|nr:amidohydrolase family protein [Planctomycetota bacterium]
MNSITPILILTASLAAASEEIVVLKVGRAITAAGKDIEKAIIVMEGGRIKSIGTAAETPRTARVVEMPQAVAMPGIVDVHSVNGLRVSNERLANVPYVTVLDGIDASSPGLENARRHGVTTVHCIAGNVTRFGGQGAVIRTSGRTVDELVVKSPSAMKMSLQPAAGENRMGNIAALRKSFYDFYTRMKALQDTGGKVPLVKKQKLSLTDLVKSRPNWDEIDWKKIPDEKVSEREKPMRDLVQGKLRAFINCPTASDVFKAFELIDTHHLDATLVLGPDAWKLGTVLAARKDLGPVVLNPQLEVWERDPGTGGEKRQLTPVLLHKAGISFALQVVTDSSFNSGPSFGRSGPYHHWYQAARLVQYGLPRAAAIETITITPAKILGLDHRIGSLEAGKDANIAIFSGDPLDARSWVERVFIEGREVYNRSKDRDLELLLKDPERSF